MEGVCGVSRSIQALPPISSDQTVKRMVVVKVMEVVVVMVMAVMMVAVTVNTTGPLLWTTGPEK